MLVMLRATFFSPSCLIPPERNIPPSCVSTTRKVGKLRCNNNELATCEASRKQQPVLYFYARRNLVFLDSGSAMEINKVTRHDYFTFENYGR